MKIDIRLNRSNRRILATLCKRLFPDFKRIVVRGKTVTFKRRWYSLTKESMQVVDLVLLHIPHQINERHREAEMNPPFEEFGDLYSAVEYFGVKSVGKDFIQFLSYQMDDLDMSTLLNEEYEAEPILLKAQEEIIVEETYATKKIFDEAITYFYNSITDIIVQIQPTLKVVYINTESACNSPPIRAPNIALSA